MPVPHVLHRSCRLQGMRGRRRNWCSRLLACGERTRHTQWAGLPPRARRLGGGEGGLHLKGERGQGDPSDSAPNRGARGPRLPHGCPVQPRQGLSPLWLRRRPPGPSLLLLRAAAKLTQPASPAGAGKWGVAKLTVFPLRSCMGGGALAGSAPPPARGGGAFVRSGWGLSGGSRRGGRGSAYGGGALAGSTTLQPALRGRAFIGGAGPWQ